MTKIIERIARIDEFDIGLEMLKNAAIWLKERNINYWQTWINPNKDYTNWIKSGFENNEFYFVEENKEIIGMYRLQYSDEMFWGKREDRAGYIHSFTTKRELAGREIGKTVLKMIENRLQKEGINYLRLDCATEIKGLCAYYEKNGFKKIEEREVFGFLASFYEKEI